MEPKVFKAMLHFIYRDALMKDELATSSSFSESDSLIAKLLAAADKYNLVRLRRMCESHLCKDITVNSVGRSLALADRYHATELKVVCLRYAAENLAGMLQYMY
ncbi:putative chromatin remodeling & transcription regulator BTB-POZ family [Helianthus annuus]|uniref:Putative SKP1/BTB/POZ domain-containing protein n=1 Tax=Helianthus annuus TaxID=4232 RepID=A0A251UJY1_HELAN|nr:putative transcription regulator TRAF family [Helianthus annuus]KAJ0561644.1 putative chromatin remodeling & transcription regulator BTB-POZ family [Helianthus annuus]KAJ0568373.1 putative chromatin remodeling & transcription regulator BTB-POZ family [Helianthus annuus]KAJ0574708.1 putative chromatin remodeling & transcription regulator BTB-POZ family [Helianthus annuus]KAJ0739039.1 putative chromatin remodeling & transcription regulator BTB-POZ family [Helianthus annuus]